MDRVLLRVHGTLEQPGPCYYCNFTRIAYGTLKIERYRHFKFQWSEQYVPSIDFFLQLTEYPADLA